MQAQHTREKGVSTLFGLVNVITQPGGFKIYQGYNGQGDLIYRRSPASQVTDYDADYVQSLYDKAVTSADAALTAAEAYAAKAAEFDAMAAKYSALVGAASLTQAEQNELQALSDEIREAGRVLADQAGDAAGLAQQLLAVAS